MFGIGLPELILILAVALIVIGPKKLPDVAKALGRAMGEFRRATQDFKESIEVDTNLRDLKEVKDAFNEVSSDVRSSISLKGNAQDHASESGKTGGPDADSDGPEPTAPTGGEGGTDSSGNTDTSGTGQEKSDTHA